MSPNQDSLYWREWAAVHRTDPSVDRHELHIAALGEDVSHKTFSNSQFDQVLGAMRAISKPASLEAQLRQLNQTKTRLIWKITVEQTTLLALYLPLPTGEGRGEGNGTIRSAAASYILAIARDKFRNLGLDPDLPTPSPLNGERAGVRGATDHGLRDLHRLDPKQLEHLRSTLAQRIQDLRKAAKHTIHHMMTLAGLPCECRQCKPPRPRIVLAPAPELAQSNRPF